MTTYNTGKVQIGLLHKRKMPAIQGDAFKLQSAMLAPRTTQPRPLLLRLLGRWIGWL